MKIKAKTNNTAMSESKNHYLIPGKKTNTLQNLSYELLYVAYWAYCSKITEVQNKIYRIEHGDGTTEDRDQAQYLRSMEDYQRQLLKITQEIKTHLE